MAAKDTEMIKSPKGGNPVLRLPKVTMCLVN